MKTSFYLGIQSTQGWAGTLIQAVTKRRKQRRKAYRKVNYKEPKDKRCLLILHLKLFKSWVKGKHSSGKEYHSLAVLGKKLTYTFL